MDEINSFNEVFAVARERDLYLDSLYQDREGQFVAAWRAGARIPGERRGAPTRRLHPFNATRDALLTLLDEAPEEDLFA
jgi:hypothetical protein